MEIVDIGGKQFTIFGKFKGANDNKFNRAAKLAHLFNSLERRLTECVNHNPISTEISRSSLACLMLMHSGIRVGNEDSADGYMTQPHPNQKDKVPEFVKTYGLTTLKKEHFVIKDNSIDILFLGKKCVDNSFTIKHPVIIAGLRALLADCSPDKYVFGITDSELTKFIKTNAGQQFSPKDFRTLRANLEAWNFLNSVHESFMNKANYKSQVNMLYTYVASKLNNTKGVCKKSYVAPEILNYMNLLFS